MQEIFLLQCKCIPLTITPFLIFTQIFWDCVPADICVFQPVYGWANLQDFGEVLSQHPIADTSNTRSLRCSYYGTLAGVPLSGPPYNPYEDD